MSREFRVWFLLVPLLWTTPALATDNYIYRSGEYVTVSGGLSPDVHWSVAAHGGGEYGYDNFHLYLMREPAHEKVGLIRTGGNLDTSPLSIAALWAPDSKHAFVMYRVDRRILEGRLIGVSSSEPRALKIPSLVDTIGRHPSQTGDYRNFLGRYYRVHWVSSRRFTLQEFDGFETKKPIFNSGLKGYVTANQLNPKRIFTYFNASALCEITESGKVCLLGVKPLPEIPRTVVYTPHLLFDPELGLHVTETTISSLTEQKAGPNRALIRCSASARHPVSP